VFTKLFPIISIWELEEAHAAAIPSPAVAATGGPAIARVEA